MKLMSRLILCAALILAVGQVASADNFTFNFAFSGGSGFGSLSATDQLNGSFLVTAGSLTVAGTALDGTYSLLPAGPGVTLSPRGSFNVDNLIFPGANPYLTSWGLLFGDSTIELNVWGNGADNYSFWGDSNAFGRWSPAIDGISSFELSTAQIDPGASAVPEPASLTLLGTALVGLAAKVRRRKR